MRGDATVDEPLGLSHWLVIVIVAILIVSLVGMARGPAMRLRVAPGTKVGLVEVEHGA